MTGIQTYPVPYCPDCGAKMMLRRPRPSQDWPAFWGCSQFPNCRGKRGIDEDGKPEMDEADREHPIEEWER